MIIILQKLKIIASIRKAKINGFKSSNEFGYDIRIPTPYHDIFFENIYNLQETVDGTYVTNPAEFQGTAGRLYVLHIKTNGAFNNYTYESCPMEMKPVPPIDSIYFERNIIRPFSSFFGPKHEGCQIYFNSFDPTNNCHYFRWDYCETWEFHLPYDLINNVCWFTNYSSTIHIKNTSVF